MQFFRKRKRADREGALFLPFFGFASIEYETRIAKLPPLTCTARCNSGELCSRCFPRERSQYREQKDKMTPCHDTQLELDFASLLCRERRRTDPERTFFLSVFFFFFRFDRVRDTDRKTLTCHVHARRYSAVSATGRCFPHVWWRELKDTK